ncbi:EAL domain, c-di-GMP-specific phosphodiesterase class I (or its enzymatically inactive variant) [Pseudobutyrivibrio sp. OR37]|uniref:EAL domain-containing protein n=1 Tax=Pseudobutyrivibrio sp. OR37 TaxID=1798186 RepID=UPI0008F03D6C|nr:EAL domain-containing protein [Pseudobutyrivibrio sp. OR37]SFI40796.1 EAL domain, c-di-GMP-specific phosphodiesterase class I (or its enzymatically inactive variant) [Pseudobutyrivibrio sp. OR37]
MEGTLYDKVVAAIENNELQAYYQPQYNPKKGVIGGAEALVRWIKPDGIIIPPNQFIPELEDKGQVSIVDWFIAEEACKLINELKEKAVKISVNFGREHAKDANFIEKLDNILQVYGVEKNLFGIEITESDVVADKDDVIAWVNRIVEAGYTVSIDDFGSGMSSLSFVKDVPANVLKIDKSFLEDNCESEKGRITLESVFYMSHRLRLTTVVEGVETKEQLDFINTCDCDYIQGYIFSKPVSRDEFYVMCTEEAPISVDYIDPFRNSTAFGQIRVLVDAVYKKFPLIIFINLTRNSYHIMKKENYIETSIPATGSYDEGYNLVKSYCSPEDYEALEKAFLRENLLDAYARGEKRVLRIVRQCDTRGSYHRIAIEDYFMENPDSNDIFMVTFLHNVDFNEETYVGDTRSPILDSYSIDWHL